MFPVHVVEVGGFVARKRRQHFDGYGVGAQRRKPTLLLLAMPFQRPSSAQAKATFNGMCSERGSASSTMILFWFAKDLSGFPQAEAWRRRAGAPQRSPGVFFVAACAPVELFSRVTKFHGFKVPCVFDIPYVSFSDQQAKEGAA